MALINLTIVSNVQDFHSIRRFPEDIKISELKNKLELLTGVMSPNMQLELRNTEDQFVCIISEDSITLQESGAKEGFTLRVQDISVSVLASTANGTNDNGEEIKKFELSEEEYDKRIDSVRAWKQKQQLGRFNPDQQKSSDELEKKKLELAEKAAKNLRVGQRCETRVVGQPPKRGTVAFVGVADFKPGYWVGVKYDEPVGKNDGSVAGKRYFECPLKYGGFVRPQDVVAGDFPELGLEDMEEI